MQVKVKLMPKIDDFEREVLSVYETGRLKSVATKAERAKFRAAARATAVKDRRVGIRLSSGALSVIQVKVLEQGVPCVLHRCVNGHQAARPDAVGAARSRGRTSKRRGASAR
jgi:predicted DNA binding CopG/RHH family protein